MNLFVRLLLHLSISTIVVAEFETVTRRAESTLDIQSDELHREQTATPLVLPRAAPDAGPSPQDANNVSAWAYHWGWHGCSDTQKTAIKDGLKEAHTVLSTDSVYYLNENKYWNDYAMVEYLGSPYYNILDSRREKIASLFYKAYQYQNSWFSSRNTQVFCVKDDVGYCRDEPSAIAIENDYDKDGLALGFCDRYFKLGTLQGIYDSVSKGFEPYDMEAYDNRARVWISAIMRVKWVANLSHRDINYVLPGKKKPIMKWGYVDTAAQAKYLAKNALGTDVGERILASPANYAWYALAAWVQRQSGEYKFKPLTPRDVVVVRESRWNYLMLWIYIQTHCSTPTSSM